VSADAKVASARLPLAAGVCDVAERATARRHCPTTSSLVVDGLPLGGGVCDAGRELHGLGAACPADAKVRSGSVCRSAAGVCDVAESVRRLDERLSGRRLRLVDHRLPLRGRRVRPGRELHGLGAACPGERVKPNNTACTDDGNVCTTDLCNGSSVLCQHAPGNAGTTCRAAAGVCDVAETCDGSSATCPADAKATSGTPCRAAAGVCDVAEACDGSDDDCPADVFVSSSTVCRSAAGVCGHRRELHRVVRELPGRRRGAELRRSAAPRPASVTWPRTARARA
jgi:hypothetical protein